MDIFGKSRLERDGARAAAGGASWRTNPFLLRENMPSATGESLADWSGRHDAWQRGFEGYFQLAPDFARRREESLHDLVPAAEFASGEPQMTSSAPMDESQQDLRELGIRRVGWRYEYRGYRYDRLADALAYARLPANLDQAGGQAHAPVAPNEPPLSPSTQDWALMATWGITFEAGVYQFKSYRYDRLADAVAYASTAHKGAD